MPLGFFPRTEKGKPTIEENLCLYVHFPTLNPSLLDTALHPKYSLANTKEKPV